MGCPRPLPDSTGNLGSARARGGGAASPGRGGGGEGRWRVVTGWVCVPGRQVQEGGGKLSSQLQLLSVLSDSATLRAPRPSPAPPAGLGAARRRGPPRPAPRGADRGAGERAGAGLGCRRGLAALGVRQGGTAECPRTYPTPPPPLEPARGRGRRMTAEPWRLSAGYRGEGRAVPGCPQLGGGYGARGKGGQVSVPPGARPAVEMPHHPSPGGEGAARWAARRGRRPPGPPGSAAGCSAPKRRREALAGSYQPGDPARAPASCLERWSSLVQTFGGAQLGHLDGTPGPVWDGTRRSPACSPSGSGLARWGRM